MDKKHPTNNGGKAMGLSFAIAQRAATEGGYSV